MNDQGQLVCPGAPPPAIGALPAHQGVCNSPIVTNASGVFQAGDASIDLVQTITTLSEGAGPTDPADDLGPDRLPCTADDGVGPDGIPGTGDDTITPPTPLTVNLFTGGVTVALYDAGSSAANHYNISASGSPLSCAAPQSGLRVTGGFVALDVAGTVLTDIVTTFGFELVPR
jgi:hypothetical protein